MKVRFIALSLGVVAMIWQASPAPAQSNNCASREIVVERLHGVYGETRKSIGLGSNNAMVETFASVKTGTWTILVTLPNGTSCLIASGESWEAVKEALPPPGKGT